jgi:inosine-uridine nucleoside N-ribohydrolase
MTKYLILILTWFFLIIVSGCDQKSEKEEIKNVILDVDTSVDDLMAILYLLTCPDIHIKAITITNGVSNVDAGTEIVLRLLDLTDHGDIPVAKGASDPIEGNNSFPKEWQPDIDQPFGLQLPAHSLKPVNIPADSLIVLLLNEYPKNISILALGPLTNIALSFIKHPELFTQFTRIYNTDGAVYVKGAINLEYPEINNTVSGWNQWVDPEAADIVFNSGSPVKLVPLDITAPHSKDAILLNKDVVIKFNNNVCSTEGKALQTLMNNWIESYHTGIQPDDTLNMVPVWDVVTALIFHHPEIAIEWKDCNVNIAQGTPETDGQILVKESENPLVRIYLKGSQTKFDSLLLKAGRCD